MLAVPKAAGRSVEAATWVVFRVGQCLLTESIAKNGTRGFFFLLLTVCGKTLVKQHAA